MMIYSYLGLSKPANIVNDALVESIKKFRKDNRGVTPLLVPGGVYGPDLTKTANFAAANDMSVYLTINQLIAKSDIIFVFLSDKSLGTFANGLRNHGIRDKIICHFSPAYTSDILDFGLDNTYVSLYIPSYRKDKNKYKINNVLIEGYGPRYEDIRYISRIMNMNFTYLSEDERQLYITAASILKDFPHYIEEAAHKLMKISLHDNPDLADELLRQHRSLEYTLNSYNAVQNENLNYVESQAKLLNTIGLKDVSSLFGAMILSQSHSDIPHSTSMSGFIDIGKSIVRKQ